MSENDPRSQRPPAGAPAPSALRGLAARLGAGAFLFFLVKGLLWLIVPGVIAAWAAMRGS